MVREIDSHPALPPPPPLNLSDMGPTLVICLIHQSEAITVLYLYVH